MIPPTPLPIREIEHAADLSGNEPMLSQAAYAHAPRRNTAYLNALVSFRARSDQDTPLENAGQWIRSLRRSDDLHRLQIGIVVLRMKKRYGSRAVRRLADQSGFGRSTLYEYAQVARFLLRWKKESARRIFHDPDQPYTYTHLRLAMRLKDYDQAVSALMAVYEGDPQCADFRRRLPMSPDTFADYVSYLENRDAPQRPRPPSRLTIFHEEGEAYQVKTLVDEAIPDLGGYRIELIIRIIE